VRRSRPGILNHWGTATPSIWFFPHTPPDSGQLNNVGHMEQHTKAIFTLLPFLLYPLLLYLTILFHFKQVKEKGLKCGMTCGLLLYVLLHTPLSLGREAVLPWFHASHISRLLLDRSARGLNV